MASDPFLLDDQPLDGTHSIQRILGPGRHSVVTATDLSEIASEISTRCGIWGGASHPIAPIEQVATSGLWRDLLESADPEVVIFANGRIDPGLHWKQKWSPAVPVAVIIAALLDEISSLATLRIPEIAQHSVNPCLVRGV